MTNLAVSPNLVTKFGGNFLLNSVDMRHDGDNLDYLTSPYTAFNLSMIFSLTHSDNILSSFV